MNNMLTRRRFSLLVVLLVSLALAPGVVPGAGLVRPARAAGPICTVDAGGGATYTTIQAAVDDAGCATINLSAGTYAEHVVINRGLALRGAGAEHTIVDGQRAGTVFRLDFEAKTSIDGITIRNGADTDESGGIISVGVLTLTNSIVTNNSGGSGGGISNGAFATMLISNTTIISNSAATGFLSNGSGAGVYNRGTMNISNSAIVSNTAEINGGGIYNEGALTIANSTVSYNRATASLRGGGGIFHDGGVLTLTNVTIAGNLSSAGGGGIYTQSNTNPATAIFKNVTISGNRATDGGAIYNNTENTSYGAATLTIASTTIANNIATTIGGASGVKNQGTITFKNTILANSADTNCANSGILQSNGFNLDSGTSCGFARNGDQSSANPQLGSLRDNGGPTLTQALQASSPAIDAGTNVGCSGTDQRGARRPVSASDGPPRCDIGPYEYKAVPTITSLNPAATAVGSPAFALLVIGANFIEGATVRWNGAQRPTTFVSSTRLIAQIGAGDSAVPQRVAVTVLNPGPSDGASTAALFTVGTYIYLPLVRK